jgi:hypothetical protein
MSRFTQLALLFVITLLSACGEVTVFGHVVREGHPKPEAGSNSAPNNESATATSDSSSTSSTSSASAAPTTTQSKSTSGPIGAMSSKPVIVQAPTTHLIKAVTLLMTPEVTARLNNDHRLNTKDLLEVVKSELQSRKLFDTDSPSSVTLQIYIDQYELHANTNFVAFGSTPHTGTLAGNLTLRDAQDNDVPVSHVEAYARIAVPESGDTPDLLRPLYKQFAITVGNALIAPALP